MPEIRELESFEDFEDAIHNGPTKDCFKKTCIYVTLKAHKLWPRLNGRGSMAHTLWAPKKLPFLKIVKVQDCDALYTRMWNM